VRRSRSRQGQAVRVVDHLDRSTVASVCDPHARHGRRPNSPCVLKPGTKTWKALWPRLALPEPGDRDVPDDCLPRRPARREDCRNGQRPCPWVGCPWHRYLSVGRNGTIWVNFPDKMPWELEDSCLLDVLERSEPAELTLETIGKLVNLTKERVRQVEQGSLCFLRATHTEE
jgi:hypothetical protein